MRNLSKSCNNNWYQRHLHFPHLFSALWQVLGINIIIIIFSHQHQLLVFRWSLNDTNSHHVSWMLRNILADLNNAMICMVLILPLISKSASLFPEPWDTVFSGPTTLGTTVNLLFHIFFLHLWQYPTIYLFFHLEQQNPSNEMFFLSCLFDTKPGLLTTFHLYLKVPGIPCVPYFYHILTYPFTISRYDQILFS